LVDLDARRLAQPNVLAPATRSGLSWRFWALIPVVGVATGLAAGALMMLLRATQHLAWAYRSGVFLTGVQHAMPARRVAVLLAAGLLAGTVRWLLRQRRPSGNVAELTAAIWFHSGRLPLAGTLIRALLSIVLVGLGASLRREAAPKQAGAVIANACWADARRPRGPWLLVVPVAVFTALGVTALGYPQILGNGKDVVQLTFAGQLPFALVLPVLALRLIATCACLASGTPGGLFTPTMTCGALLGALLSSLWSTLGAGRSGGDTRPKASSDV
jgi:chloride channel protein, CIC family